METPTMTRHCACCGKPFAPRPQVPDQAYCSSPDCQRARKRQWQRVKLQSDPDYRINQRAAQQAWSQRNQDYWRNYRDARPDYEQHNRELQRSRDARERDQARESAITCGWNCRHRPNGAMPSSTGENCMTSLATAWSALCWSAGPRCC